MKYLTFILGAGASVPYGFPTGEKLVRQLIHRIEDHKNRSKELLDKHGPAGGTNDEYLDSISHYAERIRLHDPLSIDSYLSEHYAHNLNELKTHREFIALELLHCSIAAVKNKRFSANNDENWLRYLIPYYIQLFKSGAYQECPIKLVTFNYDLCVEYYLDQIVKESTTLSVKEQGILLKWVGDSIVHVYGRIGAYEWQQELHEKQHQNWLGLSQYFKQDSVLEPTQVWRYSQVLANGLSLVGERVADDSKKKAQEWISKSKTLIVTGYGFHSDNNNLLGFKPDATSTAYSVGGVILGLWHAPSKVMAEVTRLFHTSQHPDGPLTSRQELQNPPVGGSYRRSWRRILNMNTYDLLSRDVTLNLLHD